MSSILKVSDWIWNYLDLSTRFNKNIQKDVYIFIKSTSREFRTVKVITKFRFSLSLIAIKDVILLFQIDDIGLS